MRRRAAASSTYKAALHALILTLLLLWSMGGAPAAPSGDNRARQGADAQAQPQAKDIEQDVRDDARSHRVRALVAATRSPEWKKRWDAVNELGKLKDPRGVPALAERALYDDNPHPRWRSLWALKAVDPAGTVAQPLFARALTSEHPVTARNAAVALAFFGNAEGRAVLLAALDDDRDFIRWEAMFSLRSIPDAAVVNAVKRHLDPEREAAVRVRSEAALALGRMGQWDVVADLLEGLANDPSTQVRWRAALSLALVGNACLVARIEELRASEESDQVRERIDETVQALRSKTNC